MIEWPTTPIRWIENRTLHVSVPFTWNLPIIRDELRQRDMEYDRVIVGGPAVKLMPRYFDGMGHVTTGSYYPGVLQKVNPYATRTTMGCIRKCSFCAVPQTEGPLVELQDWPDLPIICDNNLFAASEQHFDRVCDRLEHHTWCDFNQGVDARLLNDHHAERLSRLRGAIVRLALDSSSTIDLWLAAYARLIRHGFPKSRLRCYVLCGFKSDPHDAWHRCEIAEHHGVMALPQWYHPLDALEYGSALPCHIEYGWDREQMLQIMGYYYQHRGAKPSYVRQAWPLARRCDYSQPFQTGHDPTVRPKYHKMLRP